MKYQPRLHTETNEHSYSTPSISPKPALNSLWDHDLFKRDPSSSPKYLTVKVHEAKLLVDVSILGKMTTYAKFQIGPLTWKTSVDKESHMNPRWNESKTFEIQDLYKYASGIEKISKNVIIKEFLPQKINNKPEKPAKTTDAQIIVGLYDQAFLHDMLIGEVRISLGDVLKIKNTSDWFVLKSKNDIIGSIHLTFKFEHGDEEQSTNVTHGDPGLSSLKFSSSDSQLHSELHNRVATEPHEPVKYFGLSKPLLHNHRNFPSNYSDHPGMYHSNLLGPKIQRIVTHQSSDFNHHTGFPLKSRNSEQDKFKLFKNTSSGVHVSKLTPEEKEFSIPITPTENNNEDLYDEEDIARGDPFSNFSNTRSSEERKSELNNSDMTDWNAYLGGNISEENSYALYSEPSVEVQKYLEAVKKTNYEIETRKDELNSKRSALESEFMKLQKEEDILVMKKNDLDTREECLWNAKNLFVDELGDLQEHEEKLQTDWLLLNEYEARLEEAKKIQVSETENIGQLKNQIGQLSISYQREMQNLKLLEQEMYKRLIANKIHDLNAEGDGTPTSRLISEKVKEFDKQNKEGYHQEGSSEDLRIMLEEINSEKSGVQSEVEARLNNIERLKQALSSAICCLMN